MTRVAMLIGLVMALAAQAVHAEEVEAVLDKYVEARGGLAAIDRIETLRSSGKMVLGGALEAPFRLEWKKPDRFRFEMTVQGLTDITTFDGENGLDLKASEGPTPQPMGPEEFAEFNDAMDFMGPLVRSEAKGHTVELLGKEDVEGTDAWKLKLTKSGGGVEHIYLDAEHFLEIRQVEFHGAREVEVIWGDYKEVGGVLLPHSWTRVSEGGRERLDILFDGFEVNEAIGDERFTQPVDG